MEVTVFASSNMHVPTLLSAGEVGDVVQAMKEDNVVFAHNRFHIFNLWKNFLYSSFGGSPARAADPEHLVPPLFKFVASAPGMAAANH
jgi:hypothetical protein